MPRCRRIGSAAMPGRNLLRPGRARRIRGTADPRRIEQAFAACSEVRYRPMLHAGALHGYALPDRDVYDKHAANRDWENIFAMFRRAFGS
jgi:dienelactone hydrolase